MEQSEQNDRIMSTSYSVPDNISLDIYSNNNDTEDYLRTSLKEDYLSKKTIKVNRYILNK